MKSNQIWQFLKLFCRIGYFPTKQYEIPLVLFSSSCAPFSGLLSLGCECAHYHGVGLFSLIFLKRKGATIYKVLEKRESIVSVTSSSFSALLDMLRN